MSQIRFIQTKQIVIILAKKMSQCKWEFLTNQIFILRKCIKNLIRNIN